MKRFIVLLQDVGCSEQLLKRGFVQKLFPRRTDELLRQIGPATVAFLDAKLYLF